jgi:hypothetical protein
MKGPKVHIRFTAAALCLLIAISGCSKNSDSDRKANVPQQPAASAQDTAALPPGVQRIQTDTLTYDMSGIPFDLNGKPVTLAGIKFTPATQWTDFGPSGMRKASYAFGPLEGDADSATVTVFHFGQNQGGSIEANLERWINQFTMPGGRDPHTATIQREMVVDGMKVHVLTLMGTYHASVGGPMSGKTVPKENYRLAAMVVEAPGGNVFFKLTGPDYTAKIMIEAYVTMIQRIEKVS